MERVSIHPLAVYAPHLLCALAIASKSPIYQKATFFAILGFAFYVIHYTTFGKPDDDYKNACLVASVVFIASDLLLISRPLVQFRTTGQKELADSLPFLSRFRWAVHLLVSQRMVGWTGEPSSALPPRPKQTTKKAFAADLIVELVIKALLFDIAGTMMLRTSAFSSSGPGLYSYSWIYRSMHIALFGYVQFVGLSLAHIVWMLALTATGRWEPCDFRPLCGSWSQAYTVRKFWGRTWHQLLRRIFTSHGQYVTQTLLGLPKGRLSSYIQLYIAFLISGVLHYWAEFMPLNHWNGTSVLFFLLQAVIIHCEDIVFAIATRLGFRENRFWRTVGYIWMWQWFTLTVPFWVGPFIEVGYLDSLPEVGIVRVVCSTFEGRCPALLSA